MNIGLKILITIIIAIVISIIIILIGYLIKSQLTKNTETQYTNHTKSVFAKDGNVYKVHHFADSVDAANTLAEINSTLIKLISHLKYKYIGGGYNTIPKTSNSEIISAIYKLLLRYNPDNLIENSPKDKQDTSYTLNKGSMMALCLREKDSNTNLHDINTLLFVAIHELAHVAIDDDEHPPKFWKMFKFLLQEAELGGIYKSQDYSKKSVHYCGMSVNYNPLYDKTL